MTRNENKICLYCHTIIVQWFYIMSQIFHYVSHFIYGSEMYCVFKIDAGYKSENSESTNTSKKRKPIDGTGRSPPGHSKASPWLERCRRDSWHLSSKQSVSSSSPAAADGCCQSVPRLPTIGALGGIIIVVKHVFEKRFGNLLSIW